MVYLIHFNEKLHHAHTTLALWKAIWVSALHFTN
jgi:hypothetical protein